MDDLSKIKKELKMKRIFTFQHDNDPTPVNVEVLTELHMIEWIQPTVSWMKKLQVGFLLL